MGVGGAASQEGLFCSLHDPPASYSYRVDNPEQYDWCIVPDSSYDVTLFGALAVVLACLVQGRLSSLFVLLAGAALMGLAWPFNLGALGNSIAIWLGISPWQTFFYVFLPPLLLDAAVRIDWYMFRKAVVQVLILAFLVVGASCALMVPIMLYMFDLKKYGWTWIHACMFGAIVASTDAVAIVSIMKTSGGPKRLRVLLEGESLLNDASGLTLFEVFLHILMEVAKHPEHHESPGQVVGQVFFAVFKMGMIGFLLGLAFGLATRLLLRFMAYLNASKDQEVALTLAMAYLAYWVTGSPCKGSGVVAVAVMGLYGAATNHWDMSTRAEAEGTFDGFWETLAFVVNALVFLFSGASVVNFMIRSILGLSDSSSPMEREGLITMLWMLPVIFVLLNVVRFVLVFLFRPIYIAAGGDINFKETLFITAAGLRGSASLIMGQAVVVENRDGGEIVKAQIVFWTAGFVLLTLLFNAPLLPGVLSATRLNAIPAKKLERRRRAVGALRGHTLEVIQRLRDDEDELLAGVDWAQVAHFVDHSKKLTSFQLGPGGAKPGKTPWYREGWVLHLTAWATCLRSKPGTKPAKVLGQKGTVDGEQPNGLSRKKSWGSAMAKVLGKPMVSVEDDDAASSRSDAANGGGLGLGGIPEGEVHHGGPLDGATMAGLGARQGQQQKGLYAELGRPSVWAGMGPSRAGGLGQGDIESAVAREEMLKAEGSDVSGRRRRSKSSRKVLGFAKHRPSTVDEDGEEGRVGAGSGVESDTSTRSRSSSSSARMSDEESGGLWEGVLPILAQGDYDEHELPFCNWQRKPAGDSGRDLMKGQRGQAGRHQQQPQHSREGQPDKSRYRPQQKEQPQLEAPQGSQGSFPAGTAAEASRRPSKPKTDEVAPLPYQLRSLGSQSVGAAPSSGTAGSSGLPGSSQSQWEGFTGSLSPSPFARPPPGSAGGPLGHSSSGSFGSSPGAWSGPVEGPTPANRSSVGPSPLGPPSGSGHRPLEQPERALGRRSIGYGAAAAYRAARREDRALGTHSVSVAGRYGGSTEGAGFSGDKSSAAGGGVAGEEIGDEDVTGRAIPGLPPLGPALGRSGLPGGLIKGGSLSVEQPAGRGIAHSGSEGFLSQLDPRKSPRVHKSSFAESTERSLATRSSFVVAPPGTSMQTIAPSLAKMSTGLGRGVNPMMGSGTGGYPRGTSPAVGVAGAAAAPGPSIAAASAPLLRVSQKSGRKSQGSIPAEGGLESVSRMSRRAAASRVSSTLSMDPSLLEEEEELADGRSWLVSGLKRYFHAKRMEGLLSAQGLRILDSSCDMLLENPHEPLGLWDLLQRDATNSFLVSAVTYCLFLLRRTAVAAAGLGRLGVAVAKVLRLFASVLQRPLNQVLLLSVEVSMEYLMGLTNSPYVLWLKETNVWSTLVEEIQEEAAAAWQFLIDREVEAPDRYSAVQSYRAAMAVLRQQQDFVEHLFESGMIDEGETEQLRHPVEAAERRLELLGPVWKAPGVTEVVGQLPFMRGQPREVKSFFLKHGFLSMYNNDSALPEDGDLLIVQSGIVQVTFKPDFGPLQEYFLGTGGVYNLYTALTEEKLPGRARATAKGNTLGKGPIIFCFPAKGMEQLKRLAAAGAGPYQQLELDMYRLAGLFLLERLRPQLDLEVEQALAKLAPILQGSDDSPYARRIARQRRTQWVRSKLAKMHALLKAQLAHAELLVLPPNCSVTQTSSCVLLKGGVKVKASGSISTQAALDLGGGGSNGSSGPLMGMGGGMLGAVGAGGTGASALAQANVIRMMTNSRPHQYQSILPWLWDVVTPEEFEQAPEYVPRHLIDVTLTAGSIGATLLICPNDASDAALAAAEAAAAAAAAATTLDLLTTACPTPEPQPSISDLARLSGVGLTESGGVEDMLGLNPLARISGGQVASLARVSGGRSPLARNSLARVSDGNSLERISAGSGTYVKELGGTAASAATGGGGGGGGSGGKLLGSTEPLAGAIVDNRALVGVNLRDLHHESGTWAAGPTASAAVGGVDSSGSAGVGIWPGAGILDALESGTSLVTPTGAAAGGARSSANPFRRSSSAKPLRCEAHPTGERHL